MSDTSSYLSSQASALTGLDAASFSITGWLYPEQDGSSFIAAMLIEGPAFKFSIASNGILTFLINNSPTATTSSVSSSSASVPNSWNFFCLVYNKTSGTISLTLNNDTDSVSYSQPADSTTSQYVPDFRLGSTDRVSLTTAKGFGLDSVSVWARVLTAFEIATLFRNGSGLDYPFLGGPFSLIFQGALANSSDPLPLLLGTDFELWSAIKAYDSTTQEFQATLGLLFAGTEITTDYPWAATNFDNKLIVAQHDNVAQYWIPPYPNLAHDLPGLPVGDEKWDGVTAFFDHVLLWKEDRLKWSDKEDFTNYIPVAATAVSAVLTTAADFVQPPLGGTVTVTVNSPAGSVSSIGLSGDLTSAFVGVAVGTTALSILNIENLGTIDLVVTGIALPTGFSMPDPPTFPLTIPVNQNIPVTIAFQPTDAISYGGVVSVSSNASNTGTVAISGSGTGNTRVPSLGGVLSFGSIVLNKTVTSALVVTNTGNDTLQVTGITIGGVDAARFSSTGVTYPVNIAAGASTAIPVTFAPISAKTHSASITITAPAATSGVFTAGLSGTGVTSQAHGIFVTDNGTCQFGSQLIPPSPAPAPGSIRIYNTGSNQSTILGISVPGPAGVWATGSFTTTISAYSYQDVSIDFTPLEAVAYGGSVTVTTDNAGSGSVTVTGTGIASGPSLQLTGDLTFGSVTVGSSVQAVLNIKNVGNSSFHVDSISYTDNSHFTGAFSGTIAAGASQALVVTFTPSAAQFYDCTLTVNTTPSLTPNTADANGTGVALPQPTQLQAGQFVSIADGNGGYNYYKVVSMDNTTLVLELQQLTGTTAQGVTIPAGIEIFTLDANEAGETRVIGADRNGPIWQVLPMGDYAYIYKERSIQSMQYIVDNGTFFIHPEVSGEGLLAKRSLTNLTDGRMVFLGHKELYVYTGGPNITPICQQFTKELYRLLDRSRLHEIVMFNNEQKSEVWLQFPILGGSFRKLIWNYVEDSASIDDDSPDRLLTAVNYADWTADPLWIQYGTLDEGGPSWLTFDQAVRWEDLVGATSDHVPVLGMLDGNLRVWGRKFSRDGDGYLSLSETMDFDLGECDLLKYVDVVVIGLQVRNSLATVVVNPDGSTTSISPILPDNYVPPKMYIQVGGRMGLNDDDITWTARQAVRVDGLATNPVKVNPGGTGRYLRLRFSSSDPGVEWRVSSFEIHCRPGGWY